MKRRNFLKLIGAVILVPSLPVVAKPADGWFTYHGYRFRKDIRPKYGGCIQLYIEVEICGERYSRALWIDKDDYKHRDMYLDSMIHGIEKLKRRLAG